MSNMREAYREHRRARRRARELKTTTCPACGDDDGKKVLLGESCDRCGTKIDHQGHIVREEKK